jgi:hypothetical protein
MPGARQANGKLGQPTTTTAKNDSIVKLRSERRVAASFSLLFARPGLTVSDRRIRLELFESYKVERPENRAMENNDAIGHDVSAAVAARRLLGRR